MKKKIEKLQAAMRAAYLTPFRCESSYPEYDAPRNLQGRTHYADEDTLKAFRARILNAHHAAEGLLYWLVESVNSRPDHGGYTRRAIVFDVWGDIVNERADMAETCGEWFKDTRKAEDAAREFVRTFDAVKHTTEKLKAKARHEIQQARATLAILAGKEPRA